MTNTQVPRNKNKTKEIRSESIEHFTYLSFTTMRQKEEISKICTPSSYQVSLKVHNPSMNKSDSQENLSNILIIRDLFAV